MTSVPQKTCLGCGVIQTPENTSPDHRNPNGLKERCRICRREENAAYMRAKRIADLEGMRERHRQETARARARDPQKNRDTVAKWRQQFPERNRAMMRAWTQSPQGRAVRLAHHQKRRTQKSSNGGSFSAQEWEHLKQQYDYHCLCCHRREPVITLTVDHIIPLNWGGTGDIQNIQPLCLSCNTSKGSRHATDYRLRWVPSGLRQTSLDFD